MLFSTMNTRHEGRKEGKERTDRHANEAHELAELVDIAMKASGINAMPN